MASYDDVHKRCPRTDMVCLCPVACNERGSCAAVVAPEPKSHGIAPVLVLAEPYSHGKLTTDSAGRKDVPLATGCLDYFPDALAAVAALSKIGNDKHNPGQPLHWSREKSSDHADCIMRHMLDRGTIDTDGMLHDVKVAWRALAMLQLALEALK